jgi:uncharacterized protein
MSTATDPHVASEIRDGMRIDWDVPIAMDDGIVLRADVFRPVDGRPCPVLLSHGPYAKGLSFQEGFPTAWERMVAAFPEIEQGSSGRYQNWEVADPERWVPDGYACVRVDSRGAGRSPGYLRVFSSRETRDFFSCIEWAGVQPWSNGKVGLNGISYYAMNQWHVAALQPPHLAAMCVWEGAADFYRDASHHGGIPTTFWANWYDMQVTRVQHGRGKEGPRHPVTGELACGPETLDADELARHREDLGSAIADHPFDDDWHAERSASWDRIVVPLLSAGNWGGQGLHLRGNIEGFARAGSSEKWLEMHGLEHWTHFYTDYGLALQKRFFGRFLKGEDTGWSDQPPVLLQVRHPDGRFIERAEREWPLARTRWTRLHLDVTGSTLMEQPPPEDGAASYDPAAGGLTFVTSPFQHDTEVTGPLAARLFLSSAKTDADVFVIVRLFDPEGEEIVFQGALDPHTPIAQGWLRASHRELDPTLSTPERPYHRHDGARPLVPNAVHELDIEILPTSVIVPAGYRLGLTVQGHDYEYDGASEARLSNISQAMRGCGPFVHDDVRSRPPELYGGRCTVYTGPSHPSTVMFPIVPA